MNTIDREEIIWSLLMKCLTEECSDAEESELNLWRDMNAENDALYFEVNSMLKDVNSTMKRSDINSEMAWDKVKSMIHKTGTDAQSEVYAVGRMNREQKKLNTMWRVAASVVLILSVGLGYILWQGRAPHINTLVAKGSEVKNITLTDGTTVAVNGGSTLKYPTQFGGKVRGVSLTGEAFFNVAPEKQHPFIIDVDGMEVRVLGTSFNIKADDGSSEAIVTVESGVVQVTAGEKTVLIRKGESALFNRENDVLTRYSSRDVNFKAWNTKKIKFVNTPLTEAISTIEDVYKVNIEIINNSLVDNRNIDANFDKQTIDFILKTICDTHHLQYVRKGNRYVVSGE